MLGLAVDGLDAFVPELVAAGRPAPPVTRRLELVLTTDPFPEAAERWRSPGGSPSFTVGQTAGGDWVLRLEGAGWARLDASGRVAALRSSPDAHGAAWPWFVVGQVVSFAAILQGLEVLHASAVVVDGAAVAITAPSGTGKSTLALHLMAEGAAALTDDALALELVGDVVTAHPGPPFVSVPAAFDHAGSVFLGTAMSWDGDKRRRVVPRPHPAPVRLDALVVLERGHGMALAVRERDVTLTELLGATTNAVVQSAERLSSLLALHAGLAQQVRVLRLTAPQHASPTIVARTLLAHLRRG